MGKAFKIQNFGIDKNISGIPISNAIITLDQNTFEYNGEEHIPKIISVKIGDKDLVDQEDYIAYPVPAINVGEYSVIVLGNNKYIGATSVPWKISKTQGSISFETNTIEIIGIEEAIIPVKVKIIGDGEVTFSPSKYVTAIRENDKINFTFLKVGKEKIVVTLQDGKNYLGASVVINISTIKANSILEENSWETIANIAASGKANKIWALGDTKKLNLIGDNEGNYSVQIIGFNQDDLDPSDARYNSIYNNNTNKAGITFLFVELLKNDYSMYHIDLNHCSWEKSDMRLNIMPLVLEEMNDDVKSVMRIVTKKAHQSSIDTTLINTSDKLFLLGPHEVMKSPGSSAFSPSEGELYDYYVSNTNLFKNQFGKSSTSSYCYYWLRDPASNGITDHRCFCCVYESTKISDFIASQTHAIAPAFCV